MRRYYEDDYNDDHYCELTPVHDLGVVSHYRCRFCGKLYDEDIEEEKEEEEELDIADPDEEC